MADPLLFIYTTAELLLALHISLSNFMVILVYIRSKHIRTPTNAYIFSLAITDFLAGALGIPFTVASVLTNWPGSYYACLAIHLILCVLCTVSTLHLLAMAVDKYLTICLKRFDHQRTSSATSVRKTRAHFLIISAWCCGAAIAGLPMVDGFGFASRTIGNFQGECHFTLVVDYRYLVFVIFFGTIILPSFVIAYCYMAIYSHIRSEERQIKCLLRASERQRRCCARRKLIRILLILVLTYAICWYPLYLINTADLFLPTRFHAGRTATLAAVVLSHLNCALNPLIYAYGVPGFKHSLRRFLPVRASCSQNNGHSPPNGSAGAAPFPPKSPFIGYNGMPMGRKRPPMAVTMPADAMDNNRRVVPVGKFARTESTVNAVPPNASIRPPLSGQRSAQSLLETRREQFRRRPNNNDKVLVAMNSNSSQKHQLQNSSTTETEERSVDCGGCVPGEASAMQICLGPQHSSIESTSEGDDNSEQQQNQQEGKKSEQANNDMAARSKRESIVSKMSAWSVRIFNGQWLVRSRKLNSREEAQQRLALLIGTNGNGDRGEGQNQQLQQLLIDEEASSSARKESC